jgi:hypothetical protein
MIEKLLFSMSTNHFNVVEVCNPYTRKAERYAKFDRFMTLNIVREYRSEFGSSYEPIYFFSSELSIADSSMYAKEQARMKFLEQTGLYNSKFQRCEQANSLYRWFLK